jgi:sugar transferase EpsL
MKRLFDVIVSAVALILLAPALACLALLIRWKLGSPVIFRQTRPGKDATPFIMWKFRSMSNARDARGALLPDEERLTSFGRFLRSSSLDELPELVNVLRGEMSLVGPRPLATQYLPLYSEMQFRRHEVRPGITGWAQINGRNAISWHEKFKYDVWYVDNHTMMLDVRIIIATLGRIISRSGVQSGGQADVESFDGTN